MEDTIKISDIVEAMVKQGYAVVTQAYLEQCCKESAELARIKFEKNKRPERGLALWEEEI